MCACYACCVCVCVRVVRVVCVCVVRAVESRCLLTASTVRVVCCHKCTFCCSASHSW